LGFDAMNVQAKCRDRSVGKGPVRDFKGALDAKGASKAVCIKMSTFKPTAKNSRSY
jgi:restriction endonuclease Mrr